MTRRRPRTEATRQRTRLQALFLTAETVTLIFPAWKASLMNERPSKSRRTPLTTGSVRSRTSSRIRCRTRNELLADHGTLAGKAIRGTRFRQNSLRPITLTLICQGITRAQQLGRLRSRSRRLPMPPLNDLTGKRYGRLTVMKRSAVKKGHTIWSCVCDCGNLIEAEAYNLTTGHTQSCGCLQKERASESNSTHRMRNTRLYRIWSSMHTRCYRPSYHAFADYGGRGIAICDEWLHSFENFRDWALSHGYSDDLSIDRIDVDGNYEPGNCRWATWSEQNRNKRIFKKGTT